MAENAKKLVEDSIKEFSKGLELTDAMKRRIEDRESNIVRKLEECEEIDEYEIAKIGSYSRGTSIMPFNDVDLLLVLNETPGFKKKNKPSYTINILYNRIESALPRTKLRKQRRSVGILYTNHVPVDIVPVFKEADYYLIPDRKSDEWIRTNPRFHDEMTKLTHQNTEEKFIPLVRMIKYWNYRNRDKDTDKQVKPLRSFHIEVMGYEAFKKYIPESFFEGLGMYFEYISGNFRSDCKDPAKLGPCINKDMEEARLDRAEDLLRVAAKNIEKCYEAIEEGQIQGAHRYLKKIFGDKYVPIEPTWCQLI